MDLAIEPGSEHVPRSRLIAAFAAVYLIWGSTYLAIRFAIETLPPFLMAGVRFLVAGTLIYGWARLRGAEKPQAVHWRAAAVTGTLLLMGGNGAVVWAEQRVPSGVAALIIAVTPCWMVLLDWLRPRGRAPSAPIVAGLVLGLIGIALLAGPESFMGAERMDLPGTAVLVLGSLSWATGSIYSRHASVPRTPFLSTGIQMICGGTILAFAGLVSGEGSRVVLADVSARSALALFYLIFVGAIIGYSAYIWLLRVSTPARVSTYAYVNPVVAVLLGWILADEPITARMAIAACVILTGVALITLSRMRRVVTGPSPSTSGIPPLERSRS